MNNPTQAIAIYEPLYRDGQELEDPVFIPLKLPDNSHADWRELWIIVDMYRAGLHRRHRFTGLFSPKFQLKARMPGRDFVDFVIRHMSADVCFVNPFPQHPNTTYNGWTGGEVSHPGLIARTQALLDAVGIAWQLREQGHHGPDVACYCNFWVGNQRFWEEYVGGILLPIAEYLETHPSAPETIGILEPTRHTTAAKFLPFAAERLFSTFLATTRKFAVASMPLDPEAYCLNDFERDLLRYTRPRVEAARAEGFTPELKGLLQFVNLIREQQFDAYFRTTIHPHLGTFAHYPPGTLSTYDVSMLSPDALLSSDGPVI